MSHRTHVVALACLVMGLGAMSCTKKTAETSSPATAQEVRVTAVDLGRSIGSDRKITDATDTFAANDVIYASVRTSGTSPSAVLKARWTYQDGQVVDETEQSIAPSADAATEFHISKPDGWPTGKYKLEVFLNGTAVETEEFEVK